MVHTIIIDKKHNCTSDLSISAEDAMHAVNEKKKGGRRSSILGKNESDREILFRDIISVRDDVQTDVMYRALKTKAFKDIAFNMKIISIILKGLISFPLISFSFFPYYSESLLYVLILTSYPHIHTNTHVYIHIYAYVHNIYIHLQMM